MSSPDDTARSLEQWLNAYWRYLEPERLLLGDIPVLKQFLSIVSVPPDKVHSLKCNYLRVHGRTGGLMITLETGYPLSAILPDTLQQILNDKYPQFLEGIEWYNTKE